MYTGTFWQRIGVIKDLKIDLGNQILVIDSSFSSYYHTYQTLVISI